MLPHKFADKSVCIIGLGYVGLTLAVVLAEAGFEVRGVEINPAIAKKISKSLTHNYRV
jgi:UDP-N-acetyl-D-mannosaminuronic acid dehydrogenase